LHTGSSAFELARACPAAHLFSFVQGFDGKTIDLVAARARDQWGTRVRISVSEVRELHTEFRGIREDIADRWIGFAEALAQGDYASAIGLLTQQNEATMQRVAEPPGWSIGRAACFAPKEVRVLLPQEPSGQVLCREALFTSVRKRPGVAWGKLPAERTRAGRGADVKPRFVHAKVWRSHAGFGSQERVPTTV
jgi:hypothetical protein